MASAPKKKAVSKTTAAKDNTKNKSKEKAKDKPKNTLGNLTNKPPKTKSAPRKSKPYSESQKIKHTAWIDGYLDEINNQTGRKKDMGLNPDFYIKQTYWNDGSPKQTIYPGEYDQALKGARAGDRVLRQAKKDRRSSKRKRGD